MGPNLGIIMLISKICNIIILLLHFIDAKDKLYGPFDIRIIKADSCHGPKSKECANLLFDISENRKKLVMIFDLHNNVRPEKGKIIATSNGKQLMRMQLDNPCNHLFIRPLLDTLMNITSDCEVIKGHYKNFVDIDAIAKQYFGGSFVYGNLTFKSVFYNRDCNMSCCNLQVELYPV